MPCGGVSISVGGTIRQKYRRPIPPEAHAGGKKHFYEIIKNKIMYPNASGNSSGCQCHDGEFIRHSLFAWNLKEVLKIAATNRPPESVHGPVLLWSWSKKVCRFWSDGP
jgi:hypothetical protein